VSDEFKGERFELCSNPHLSFAKVGHPDPLFCGLGGAVLVVGEVVDVVEQQDFD
jgi:hypothetical protein